MKPLKFKLIAMLLGLMILALIVYCHSYEDESTKSSLAALYEVQSLDRAYAHNDYEHAHPLFDALSHGFTFIEVDIHLIRGKLFVNHLRPIFPSPKRTLTKLYLEPLFEIQRQNGGKIFADLERPLVLVIDIKTEAVTTYKKLLESLKPYQEMFSYWREGREYAGAVKIVLTGNRPIDLIREERQRYVQLDGRVEELSMHYPNDLMPMISADYDIVFGKRLFKESMLEPAQLKTIAAINKQVHAQGKVMRIWHSPEKEAIWDQLEAAGVDLLCTDELEMKLRYLTALPSD